MIKIVSWTNDEEAEPYRAVEGGVSGDESCTAASPPMVFSRRSSIISSWYENSLINAYTKYYCTICTFICSVESVTCMNTRETELAYSFLSYQAFQNHTHTL